MVFKFFYFSFLIVCMSGVLVLVVIPERVAASVSAFSALDFRVESENSAVAKLDNHVVSK